MQISPHLLNVHIQKHDVYGYALQGSFMAQGQKKIVFNVQTHKHTQTHTHTHMRAHTHRNTHTCPHVWVSCMHNI